MRVTLIYNPHAGTGRLQRRNAIIRIAEAFEAAGHTAESIPTQSKGSAGSQAADAIRQGAELIFACGGDGTVHDVLQGVVGTEAVLGVIPMGSANALARDLVLPMDPVEAARKQLGYTARRVPVGKMTVGNSAKFFAVMAGAGPDGALVYRMVTDDKRSLGRLAYYLRAARIFLGRRFPAFNVRYFDAATGVEHSAKAVSAMAVRIGDLGGIFSRLSRGGKVDSDSLHLILVKPPGWLGLPLWFALSWIGLHRWNPLLKVVNVTRFACDGAPDLQVDGEWAGRGPMQVELAPDALRLLMPPEYRTGIRQQGTSSKPRKRKR